MQTPESAPTEPAAPPHGAAGLVPHAHDLTVEEWEQHMVEQGEPVYRGKQIFRWLHHRLVGSYKIMTDLSDELRASLTERVPIIPIELIEQRTDPVDGTVKALWKLEDGEKIEAVKMTVPRKDGEDSSGSDKGATLCLSSQAGCALACRFCATGQIGERRNMTAGEIVQQVYRHWEGDPPVKRIVFMGMGEPLRNYDNVLRAITLLRDESGLNLSPRRITISTAGLVPEIYRLAQDRPGVRLAVSLFATTDTKRRALAPVTRGYTLARLLDAVRTYQKTDGQRVSFEYVLLPGQNDSSNDAQRLAELIEGIVAHINIIPYNPVDRTPFQAPSAETVHSFLKRVREAGADASVRWSRGSSIKAACGQLRAELTR